MKEFTIALLVVIIVSAIIIFCYPFDDEKIMLPNNIYVLNAEIVTREKSPEFFENGIDYEAIRKNYPEYELILSVGFKANLDTYVPTGVCIDDGQIINVATSDMGLLCVDSCIRFGHGHSLLEYILEDSIDMIQVQSLVHDGKVAVIENDVKEDHFVLVEDTYHDMLIWQYSDSYLSTVIKHLESCGIINAFKIGGGSANGGIFFDNNNTVELGCDLDDSPMVVALLLLKG